MALFLFLLLLSVVGSRELRLLEGRFYHACVYQVCSHSHDSQINHVPIGFYHNADFVSKKGIFFCSLENSISKSIHSCLHFSHEHSTHHGRNCIFSLIDLSLSACQCELQLNTHAFVNSFVKSSDSGIYLHHILCLGFACLIRTTMCNFLMVLLASRQCLLLVWAALWRKNRQRAGISNTTTRVEVGCTATQISERSCNRLIDVRSTPLSSAALEGVNV